MAYQSAEIARLQAEQEALDKQLAEARERETQQVLQEIVQKMREYGISLHELTPRSASEPPPTHPPKYRDPVSGATWSGRGREPRWIAGKDRNDFLIENACAASPVKGTLFPVRH